MVVEGAKPALVSIYDYYDTKDKWVFHVHGFFFKTDLMFLRIYLPPPPEFEIYRDLSEFIWIFVYLPSYIIKYLGPKFFTLWRKRKKRGIHLHGGFDRWHIRPLWGLLYKITPTESYLWKCVSIICIKLICMFSLVVSSILSEFL